MPRLAPSLIVTAALAFSPAHAQLLGHGGPVRALVISSDGANAISGGLDTFAIYWSLTRNVAEQMLPFHESTVSAVAFLPFGRMVTGDEDGRIALWAPGGVTPVRVLEGHTKPIGAFAVSPDGKFLASASWDRTIRLWPLTGGQAFVIRGHQQNVTGVAFIDAKTYVSVSHDSTLRIWTLFGGAPKIVTLPTPLNAVAVARDGEIIAGGEDGRVFFVSRDGEVLGEVAASDAPVIAVALSPDGTLVAAAGFRGAVAIIDRKARSVARTLARPGLPAWSATFMPDNRTLLTGGADGVIRRWNVRTGEHINSVALVDGKDPLAAYKNDHGAEVFRACVACHSLRRDDNTRAGPTLAGIFGRKIATLEGYYFSPALKKLDIVWAPQTLLKLFEAGPTAVMPGSKMPEQKIGAAEDRAALVKFLEKAASKN